MKVFDVKDSYAKLELSIDELLAISNAINELCYGIDMSDADLAIRIGATRPAMIDLQKNLLEVVDGIESANNPENLQNTRRVGP